MGRPDCGPDESDNSDLSRGREADGLVMSEVEIRGLDVRLMEWQESGGLPGF